MSRVDLPPEQGLQAAANLLVLSGTFARVWLARLKGDERKDRVYALKILRKADGMDDLAALIP